MSGTSEQTHQRPDGTPKNTGRELHEGIATVRIDDSQAPNGRVTIHVEHPDHDGGTRAFWRRRDGDVAGSIKSHLRTELEDDLARVEVIDTVGLGIAESDLLPRGMARSTPFEDATEVAVRERTEAEA